MRMLAVFEKGERIRHIGHLDIQRSVQRGLRRSGLPVAYSQGFNPHITLARKPLVPEHVSLSEIEVPRAAMTVRDICLFRSEHRENGMEYTVIGRSKRPGA